eukprot:6308000-Prymnesium_polylepis.1
MLPPREPKVVDSALPHPCVRDEPALGRVGARGGAFMIVPARACVSPPVDAKTALALSPLPHTPLLLTTACPARPPLVRRATGCDASVFEVVAKQTQ